MSANDASDISSAVVDNDVDFLRRAVQAMVAQPPVSKYAAMHLIGAIEVLIKTRVSKRQTAKSGSRGVAAELKALWRRAKLGRVGTTVVSGLLSPGQKHQRSEALAID